MKTPRNHILFWGSSYDRGLDILLYMWPDIIKKFPDAQLHICYGWEMFMKIASNNPERMKWKKSVETMMQQRGIYHHGRLGKVQLKKIREKCGIWAYPTYFTEINCITALDCQLDGVVPVVCNFISEFQDRTGYTALNESVKVGIKVEGHIEEEKTQEEFVKKLLGLMGDYEKWKKMSTQGKLAMMEYSWPVIAEKWTKVFAEPLTQPLVSIITPTIRKGFWNIMALMLNNQTYKNIEWIVVDDYPENRRNVMRHYCNGFFPFKYIRGNRTNKFFYGLSTANNIGWQNANGELIVYLQDFIIIPNNGIEMLVDVYRHNPNCLIAPTDSYYDIKGKVDVDSEDWFNSNIDVVGNFVRGNVRNIDRGIRFSDWPFDYEMNYGAIPKKVIEHMGGWYEFFNDGLGFDNTEFCWRAMKAGHKLIIDDTNKAICLEIWKHLENKQEQLGEKRTHRLNDPRYLWMQNMINNGRLPLLRDPKIDTFRLEYSMPNNLSQDEATDWIRTNAEKIAKTWDDVLI
jgi:glycosyltransferase involved in cell wall biosynthesis